MTKRKIEVVKINLDLNVEKELANRHSSLSDEIKIQTTELIEKAKHKQIKSSRKKFEQEKIEEKLQTIYDELIKGEPISKDRIMSMYGDKQLSPIIVRLKTFLRKKGNEWVVSRHKHKGVAYYSLQRFSDLSE